MFSYCGREEHRCLERMSRCFVHEGKSYDTAGMASAHLLHAEETLVIEESRSVPDPADSRKTITLPSFSWWSGGIGCQIRNPNKPGHVLKIIAGRGQHGADTYRSGLKMMEIAVITRFCHPPINSYLFGSGDVEIKKIR